MQTFFGRWPSRAVQNNQKVRRTCWARAAWLSAAGTTTAVRCSDQQRMYRSRLRSSVQLKQELARLSHLWEAQSSSVHLFGTHSPHRSAWPKNDYAHATEAGFIG